MLLVVPVSRADKHRINKFIRLFDVLHPGEHHDILVVGSPNVSNDVDRLRLSLGDYFYSSRSFIFSGDSHMGWPMACNYYWQQAVYYISNTYSEPWLWMELDSVPLETGWLSDIESEYSSGDFKNLPFMGVKQETITGFDGNRVPVDQAGYHMCPVGVYPSNVPKYVKNLPAVQSTFLRFSHFTQWMVVPLMRETKLIQNNWRTVNYRRNDGQIICDSDSNLAWQPYYNESILHNTVVLHGCKDDSICNLILPN